jgi:Leucine-rich repeat (LRR) protein
LEVLLLDKNQLSEIPKTLGKLTSLRRLDLSYNQLASLPANLGQLTNLAELSVAANQLNAIPFTVAQLPKLQHFKFQGNPLNTIPPEARNSSESVLTYLRQVVKSGQKEMYRMKLMIVGQENVSYF